MHARGENGRKPVRAAALLAFLLPGGAIAGEIKVAFQLEGEHHPPYALTVRRTDVAEPGAKGGPPYRVDYGVDRGLQYSGFISSGRFDALVSELGPDLDAIEKAISAGGRCGTHAFVNFKKPLEGAVCGDSKRNVTRVMEAFKAYVDFDKPPKKR